jgi:predicted RNA methylase
MLPFGPIPDEAGRGVILSADHADAVLAYCHAMGSKFGSPGYLRYLFGLPVNQALLSGYLMTQRALRETTPHACAEEIARTALELLSGLDGGRGEDRSVLDIFAGIGQMAYSYAKAGCHVQAVDNDRTTVDVAVHNMALAGLAAFVEYRLGDGPATLASAVNTDQRFSIVHLDPPWRGTYHYDLTRPFRLEGLAVDVAELIRLGLRAARLVVLNLPHNALSSQIGELAALAGCNALVQYQYVSDFPASFAQAPAYFFGRSGGGHGETTGCQERRQRLTVDGQRVLAALRAGRVGEALDRVRHAGRVFARRGDIRGGKIRRQGRHRALERVHRRCDGAGLAREVALGRIDQRGGVALDHRDLRFYGADSAAEVQAGQALDGVSRLVRSVQ